MSMSNFHGFTKEGRQYDVPVREILPAIIATPKTIRQIEKEAGRDYESIRKSIERFRKQSPSPIRIAGWSKEGSRRPAAMYVWQHGEDSPRPKAMTSAEKSRRYRETPEGWAKSRAATERWKATPSAAEYKKKRYQTIRARIEAKRNAIRLLRQIDPLMAAFNKGA